MNDRDPLGPDSPPPGPRPSWREQMASWWQPRDHPGCNRLQLTWARLDQWYAQTALGGWLTQWQDRLSYRTADEAVQFWQSLFRWQTILKIVLVLALGFTAAGVLFHSGRHWYRQHQEQQLARQAEALLDKGEYKQAYFRAQMGLRLDPNNPVMLRITAAVMAMAGNTNALYWGRRVLQLNPDFTNQLALASLAMQVEPAPFPTAAQVLNAVAPAQQQTPEFQRLAGWLAVRSGQTQAAVSHFAQLVLLEPANDTNHLQLAALQLLSTNASDQQTGIASLQHLAARPPTHVEALRFLVGHYTERSDWAGAEPFSLQLAAEPGANMGDQMALLTILQNRHNPAFSNQLAQAEALAGTNYPELLQLTAWMNTHNCARQTLDWLSHLPASLAQQGALPATSAEAYANLGAWPEMEKFLLQTNWPALEPFRQAYLAHAADQLGSTMEGETAWVIAVRLATPSVQTLRILEQMTRVWNWPDRQEELLWLTAERYPEQSWAWTSLTQLIRTKKDTRRMWRLAKLQYEQHPEDDHLANDYAAYALLVNEDLNSAQELARAIHLRHPADAIMATTYALAKLKVGDTNAALVAFRQLSPELLHTPVIAAYYGIALAICGDQDNARIYLSQSAPARLLPEEAALVTQARDNPWQLTQELVPPAPAPLFTASKFLPAVNDTPSRWRLAKGSYLKDPADATAGSQYASLSLLLKTDLPQAQVVAARLYAAHPTNQACLLAFAFSKLNQGLTNEALAVFAKSETAQWTEPSAPIYYGLTLAANGLMAQARSYLDQATNNPMLPEEARLVQLAGQSGDALRLALQAPPPHPAGNPLPPFAK